MGSDGTTTMVRALLERCLDRIAGESGASAIWRVWDDAVGAQVARRAQPIRLRGRTLLVAVSSAPWMQELQLLKRTILAELNARLATPLVADLFFVLTEGRPTEESPARSAIRTCPPAPAASSPPAAETALPEQLRTSLDAVVRAWRRRATSARS